MSRAFLDLFLQPVIEVVVHLLHELVVGKLGKDDLVVGHFVGSSVPLEQRVRAARVFSVIPILPTRQLHS